jgi:hypothetical protein
MKKYIPKKKSMKYNDLASLSKEMTENGIKHKYNGLEIRTKSQKFTMVDSQVLTFDL